MESRGYRPEGAEVFQIRPGLRGLVLADSPEALPPEAARRFENWRVTGNGRVQVRAGLNTAVSLPGTAAVHTLARLYQPSTGTFIAFLGKGGELLRGATLSSFSPVYSAFSGDPLSLVPYRPAVSGDPWLIVGDRLGVGQVPASGEPSWLGLPAPVVGPVTRIADILTTNICSFDGSTAASAWTLTAGVDDSAPPIAAGPPTAADVAGLQGNCVEFTTFPGLASKGYTSVLGLPKVMDLTQLQGGFRAAEDEDIIHLWMRVNRPGLVEEIRVYFVCASGFSANLIPGQNDTLNTDAFVKTFVPSDLTGFVETQESGDAAAEAAQSREALEEYLRSRRRRNPKRGEDEDTGDTTAPDDPRGTRRNDPGRALSETLSPGRNTWTEFGTIGVPLRRRDFTRIGNTTGRGWDTITGLVIVVKTRTNDSVKLAFDDWFLTGGYGLDVSEVGTATYDYRYTHYHLDTGDESNPCVEQAPSSRLSPVRQRIKVQPAAPFAGPGQARIRQRFYRRGGTLLDDWYYVGQNTTNGAEFIDSLSDLEIAAAPTLELDNYQAVPTQDSTGATVLAQPLPALWGPVEGSIYGCGDARRPGYVYRSKPGRPGSWPPANAVEVCSPSEELMHGGVYAGQAFVFSRRRLYSLVANPATGQVAALDTPCQKGLAGRWAFDIGPDGVYFVADDGIYVTNGGAAKELSADIRLLWTSPAQAPGATVVGELPGVYLPNEAALRLTVAGEYLYFFFQGHDADYHTLVYHLRLGVWSRDVYAVPVGAGYWDRENPELPVFFGTADGVASRVFGLDATSDAGTPVVGRAVTGDVTGGRAREEKQLGDLLVQGAWWDTAALTVQPVFDGMAGTARTLAGTLAPAQTEVIDIQDGDELRFRALALDITATRPVNGPAPELWQMLLTYYPLAEETYKRLSQWEPLGDTGGYLTGVSLVADTRVNALGARDGGGDLRTIFVEYSRGGTGATLGPFTVDASEGRRAIHLSWPGVRADHVRIVPQDDNPWLLYSLKWQATPEPLRATSWDSGEEVLGDQYYTGLDLVVDTHGNTAQLTVYVDGTLIYTDPTVTTPGKRFLHFTFTPGYGHIFQAVLSVASGTVTVYEHAWQVVGVPAEQANWNRNYELGGTLGDKLVKGVLLDCDTGGVQKLVDIQADGVLQQTIAVTAPGRRVLHFSWPQFQGRVLRIFPIDTAQGRLFSVQWIFDEEPLGLARWETQGQDHGQREPHSIFELQVEYRAPQDVTLIVTGYGRDGDVLFEDIYTLLASTTRRRTIVELVARRALLWKYLFTSDQAFWLYREGSAVVVLPWTDAGEVTTIPAPFGTDDLDKQRSLGNASGIAATPNNGRGARA